MQLITTQRGRFAVGHTRGAAPTVVFETGLGAESSEWAPVAHSLAPRNATFVYDRLNRGKSGRVDGPRTSLDMATDLRTLLAEADAVPPYVVVGHSFGAHVALAVADGAADVAGIVLVEPTHPRQFDSFGPLMPEGEMRQFWTVGWRRTDSTAEHIDLPASFAATGNVTLGTVPVVVLIAGSAMAQVGPEPQRLWIDMAQEWLGLSEQVALQVISDSGHFIQRDRPDSVVTTVETLLASVK